MLASLGAGQRVPMILYFITGVFWIGVIATGGGILLVWAALTCFVAAVILLLRGLSWATRPMTIAAALFGLCLTVYQVVAGASVLTLGLGTVGIVSVGLFGIFTIVYVYLLLSGISGVRSKPKQTAQ